MFKIFFLAKIFLAYYFIKNYYKKFTCKNILSKKKKT